MKNVLAGIYFFIGFIYGMFLYGESKVDCIDKVGLLKGVFIGCDDFREVLMYRGEPSLIKSQLKGLVWPYFMFFDDKDQVADTQAKPKPFDYSDLAQMLVDAENSRAPRQIDKYTVFKQASLASKSINFKYELEGSSIQLIRTLQQEATFKQNQKEMFCRDKGDKTSKVIQGLLNSGFSFQFVFESSLADQSPIELEIASCS